METKHQFTLILDGVPDLTPEILDRLFEAGCDDALVSRCDGEVSMDFDRTATDMGTAIHSAIIDIRKADIGARVVRVEEASPDPGEMESFSVVDTINSTLRVSAAIKFDPTLRTLVGDLLGYVR